MKREPKDIAPYVVPAALVALVAAVYAPVGGYGFVAYDDNRYVYENPVVKNGLTRDGVVWAFTSFHASNWHPLTWLSHMLDVELFGLDAGWHHRVNALLHAANAVLLFWVLRAATRSTWRPAVVAALFAVHPIHVESVAWIAERKDVLSTMFWLLTLAAYVRYARRRGPARYALVAVLFTLGLLSKPMVVTLPLVLLLLDFWPLGDPAGVEGRGHLARRALEKVPLLVLSAGSCLLTVLAQSQGGAISGSDELALSARLANAVVSYASYPVKIIWPSPLAVFYPHPGWSPGGIPALHVAVSLAALGAFSALVVLQRRSRPFLAMGWGWYLVTLAPVIGVVQVGLQGMADRYTYIPSIGLLVAAVWSVAEVAWSGTARRVAMAGLTCAMVSAAAVGARIQVRNWKDSFSLFKHATEVTPESWLAWKNLGVEYFERGELEAAVQAFRESLKTRVWDDATWMNLGLSYGALGRHAEAAEAFRRVLRIKPDDPDAWFNLAMAYALQGREDAAAEAVEELRRRDPARARDLETRLEGP